MCNAFKFLKRKLEHHIYREVFCYTINKILLCEKNIWKKKSDFDVSELNLLDVLKKLFNFLR